MNDFLRSLAQDDFDKARAGAFLAKVQRFFNPDEEQLISLNDAKAMLRPKGESYKGLRTVPVDLIVGSEGRYKDFNRLFLPKRDHLRSRWERVDMARLQQINLPPVKLYELGGLYFVRDGNHRVSVAKAQGQLEIDAEVVALDSEITLDPDLALEDLRREVVRYEKRAFYAETFFGDLTDFFDLDFSSPGRYDVVLDHIGTHKYYINQGATAEIPFEQALLSWFNSVYMPFVSLIREARLLARFPKRTEGDLYLYLVRYWDEVKRDCCSDYSMDAAAREFSEKYGKSPGARLAEWFRRALRSLRRDEEE